MPQMSENVMQWVKNAMLWLVKSTLYVPPRKQNRFFVFQKMRIRVAWLFLVPMPQITAKF